MLCVYRRRCADLARAGSPYTRETYRYTPLLAALLTPNIWLHASFGKYLFAACDILVGVLLHRLLRAHILVAPAPPAAADAPAEGRALERKATLYAALHLLNPLVFSISTRGSSESTLGALVVATLYFALSRRWDAAAVLLGLATHWKIYPVIYAASLVGVISAGGGGDAGPAAWPRRLFNRATVRFALLSGGTFALLSAAMYLMYVHRKSNTTPTLNHRAKDGATRSCTKHTCTTCTAATTGTTSRPTSSRSTSGTRSPPGRPRPQQPRRCGARSCARR